MNVSTQYKYRGIIRQEEMLEELVEQRVESLQQTMAVLMESESRLKAQLYVQTRIVASLSHDFRSPLQAIVKIAGAIDSLVQQQNYEFVSEIGKSIEVSSQNMSVMLDHTLDYLKIDLAREALKFELFSLHELVMEKIDFFSLSSDMQKNNFVNNIPVDLTVKSNPLIFGIILNNLLDNANKNTNHGFIIIYAELTIDQLVVKVSDTGSGISDHLLDWLNQGQVGEVKWERDHQIDGEGVGLVLVKEMVQILGGVLYAKRNEIGSTVSLILPLQS